MPRRYGVFWAILWSAVFVLNSTVVAQSPAISNVFDMPAGLTSLKFSNVGDPGNAADTAVMNTTSEDILNVGGSPDHSTGYGSVAYNYAIGTYDVTAAQYVQFLNAVAKTGDPYGLYNPLMGGATSGPASSDPHDPIGTTTAWVTISSGGVNYPVVCGITRTGTAGNYSYALSTTANLGSPPIPATNGNFPVNWDNWGDAARFTNWLENGQPVGPEGLGTTETGSYTLNGAVTVAALFGVTKNSGATYWIPTENEWYKAAYYKGGSTNAGYWTYTTKSNTAPSSTLSATGANNANFNSSGLQGSTPWILTPVGYYAGSPGPYGTYDQGGDTYDFTSTPVQQSSDGTGEGLDVYVMRGGSFHKSDAEELNSDYRTGADPAKYGHARSFRLATWYNTVWNGGGTGGNADNWSSPSNWTGAVPAMAGGLGMAVEFGPLSGGHAANFNDLAAGTQINGISFDSGAGVYDIEGNSILLGGPITNQSSAVQSIGLAMQLVAGGGAFNASAGDIAVTGPLTGTTGSAPLVKSGTGTLTLSGNDTYTGATNVYQGVLALAPGGSLGNTAVTIGNPLWSGAALQVNGNYTIGTGGGASLAVGSGAAQGTLAFDRAELGPSTLSLSGSMVIGGITGSPAILDFNMGSDSVDTIVAGTLTVNSVGAVISLNQLPGAPIAIGTYDLIIFGSGSGLSGLTFAGGGTTLTPGNGDTYVLVATPSAEELMVTVAPPANAYWTGAQGTSSWSTVMVGNSTNWASTANGPDTNSLPGGGGTNVFFTASGASNYETTTLDASFSINSLTFSNSDAVGIAPGTPATNALMLAGSGGRSAITVNPGAGPVTISAPLVIAASQTWTNNSSSQLTISGSSIANTGNTLTLAGSGDMQLSAAINGSGGLVNNSSGVVRLSGLNTFSGQTQVTGPAALLLANSSALQNSTYIGGAANGLAFVPGIGTFTLGGLSGSDNLNLSDTDGAAVTLQVGNNGASTNFSGALSGPGGLAKIGSGVLSLTGLNTFNAATSVSQGTLALGPGGTLSNTAVTVGNGTSGNGVLQINGNYAIGKNLAVGGGGTTTGQGTVTFNPAESATSSLSVGGAMTVGGASGSPALLNFNVGNNSVDEIAAGSLTVNPGGAIIGLDQLPGLSIVSGTYSLITFNSGTGLSGLTFPGGSTTLSQNGDTFKLVSTASAEQLSVVAPPAVAYWTGAQGASWSMLAGGGSTNWGNAAGTDINQLPSSSTNVFFTASGASNFAATTLDGNFAVNSLTFSNSGAVSIASGSPAASTLTLAGTLGASGIIVNQGAGTVTVSAPLALATPQTWTNDSSNSLAILGSVANNGNTLTLAGSGGTTFSGTIAGGGGITVADSGLVVVANSTTYTGATTVSNGTLSLAGSGTILGSTSVIVNAGGRLLINNSTTLVSNRIGNSVGVTLNGGAFSMLGNNSSPGAETVGALTLGPGVSALTVSRGTVAGRSAELIFGTNTSALSSDLLWTANAGSMLDVTATIPGQGGPGGAYTGGGITTAPGDYVTFGGAPNAGVPSINDPAAWIVVNGHAFARYSHSNGIHEETANSEGNITNFSYELGAAGANANVVITGLNSATPCGSKTINDLMVQCATPYTSTLTGTLNIMNNGGGSGTPLDANGGILVSGSAPFSPSGGYTMNGGTITSGNFGTNSTLYTWIDSGTTTINSVIADVGGGGTTLLAKAGNGTLVLGGDNSYSAGTALDQGVLDFASGTLPIGASSIHFYGGTLQWASGNTQDVSAAIAPIANGQTAILDTNGNNVSFATGLSGGGGLSKAGSGILTLTSANTYAGGTTISGGTLNINTDAALGATTANPNISFNGAGTLQFATGINGTTLSGARNITVSSNSSGAIDTNGNNIGWGGALNNAGVFTKAGSGMLEFDAAPTLQNNSSLYVSGGTLVLANGTASTVGSGVTVAVAAGATLELAGSAAALTGAVNITTNGSGDAGDGALTLTGATNQTVGVVGGTATSSNGATTYSGNTSVGDGANVAHLTAAQILQNTLTIAAGSTVTIAPSGGGVMTVASASSAPSVASNTASVGGSSDAGSDPLTAIQGAIASASITSAKGQQLENRIAAIERLATTEPGLDVGLLVNRVLAASPSSSILPSTDSSRFADSDFGLLTVDSSAFGSSSSGEGVAFASGASFGGRPAAVPEPSTLLLAVLGGIGLVLGVRRPTSRRNSLSQ